MSWSLMLLVLVAAAWSLPTDLPVSPDNDASLNEVEIINPKLLAEQQKKQQEQEETAAEEQEGVINIDIERNGTSSSESGEDSAEESPFPLIYGITRVRVFAIPVRRADNSTAEEDDSDEVISSGSSSNCTVVDDGNSTDTSSGCGGKQQGGLRHYLVRLFCHRSLFLDFTVCQLFK